MCDQQRLRSACAYAQSEYVYDSNLRNLRLFTPRLLVVVSFAADNLCSVSWTNVVYQVSGRYDTNAKKRKVPFRYNISYHS